MFNFRQEVLSAHCQSFSNAGCIGHKVWEGVLLDGARKQVGPWPTGVHRHILSSVRLRIPWSPAGVLEVHCAIVHAHGILSSRAPSDVPVERWSIGVVHGEVRQTVLEHCTGRHPQDVVSSGLWVIRSRNQYKSTVYTPYSPPLTAYPDILMTCE